MKIYLRQRLPNIFLVDMNKMPFRRIRRIRRRRYGGIRKRLAMVQARGSRPIYDSIKPASRRVHRFKRFGQPIILSNSANAPLLTDTGGTSSTITVALDDFGTQQVGWSSQFQLNACQEYQDFTQLFDRYKIVGVKLKFMYQANCVTNNTQGVPSAPMPLITYSYDADDNNSPTNRTAVQVKQYAKEKLLNANRPFSVFYKPRISKLVYNGITPAYTTSRPEWLDCSNSSVPHYGVKFWINNWLADSGQSNSKLTIQPIYYLALRDTQ